MTLRRRTSAAIVVLLAGQLASGVLAQSTQTPVRDGRREPVGTAVVGGVVRDAADQRPLRRATVRISGDPLLTARQTVTRDDGSFVFDGLPPGSYSVSAGRSTYMGAEHGARRPGGTGSAIVLAVGQRVTNLVFALQRYGSIAGTIYDQNGTPAPGVSVEALRYTMRTGRRTLSSVYGQPATTDDRGVYRLAGLLPGEYYVATGPSPDRGPTDVQRLTVSDIDRMMQRLSSSTPQTATFTFTEPHQGYAPVYFPGSTDFGAAQRIAISLGEERAGVDIRLQLVPTARVDGTLTRFDGQPMSTGQIAAVPVTEANSMDLFSPTAGGTAAVDAKGHFTFPAVPPGTYVLTARVAPSAADAATGPLWAMAETTVSGSDQSVSLVLQPGMKVSGRVAFEGTTLQKPASAAGIRINMPNVAAGITIGVPTAITNPDGTFALPGAPPGQYKLTALAPVSPPGWAVRSAMLNGVDVLDSPFAVVAGQDVTGVVLTYTDRPTELSGSLQTPAGDPTSDYFIIVFAADRAFWTPSSRRQTMVRPLSTGRYTVRNLPPGEYCVAAVTDAAQGDWFDPTFLERLLPAAARVTIGENERKALDLKIGGSRRP